MILRKYNTAATIDGIPLVKRNSIDFKANPTLAAGDVKISKDGGAFANLTTLPTVTPASGEFVEIALSATEMQAARVAIKFVDQTSPKEWEDQAVLIETYGHASAAHPFDLGTASTPQTGDSFARLGAPAGASVSADVAAVKADTAAVKVKTDFLPSATAGTAGGVFIAGTNAATSVTTALTANVTGNLSGSVGSVTGNVGGNVVGSVGSVVAGVTLAASAVQAIWDALTSALTTVGSIGKKLADWVIGSTQTGDSFARLGAPAGASVSADVAAVKSDTAAALTRLPSALVGGRIDASVGAMAADVVTAASIAPNAIGASELAADAVTEIQAGLATASTLATVQADTDALQVDTSSIIAGLAAINADTDNIQTRLPAALVGGKMDSVVSGGGGGGAWTLTVAGQPRLERPSSGSVTYEIHLFVENAAGTPVALDSTPTVTATQNNGTDLSANLSAVSNPNTGHYVVTYTVSAASTTPIGVYVQFVAVLATVTKRVGIGFDVVAIGSQAFSMSQTGVNVSKVEGQTLSGKTGENFQAFFNNNGSDTTKIVQDTGGTATIQVTLGAIMAVSVVGNRVAEPLILEMFQGEEKTFSFTVLDANGAAVSYAGKTLRFTVFDTNKPPVAVFESEGANITITGTGSNVISVKVTPTMSALANEDLKFQLWDVTNAGHEPVITWGQLKILPAIKDV